MSRYIDADVLKQSIRKKYSDLGIRIGVNGIINEQPTVDVVEVVRCKDCIHMNTDKCPSRLNDADFYCCQGERREDAEIH